MKRFSRVLRFADVAVRVVTNRAGDLRWLEEFVCPAMRAGTRGPVDVTVRHVTERSRRQSLLAAGPDRRRRKVECFYLDTKIVRCPRWASTDEEVVARDEELGAFYVVNRPAATIDIVADPRDRGARLALMRVIREIASSTGHTPGRLVVHGAAARVGERGVVIAGDKNAGKTTLLVHALRQSGAAYLSNDRVLIEPEAATCRVLGIPTIVSVRHGTLRRFPDVARRLRSRNYAPALRLVECSRGSGRSKPWSGRYTMSPRQLRALLRAPALESMSLSAFVFPRVTSARGAISLTPLPTPNAARAIRRALFRAASPRRAGGLFNWFGAERGAPAAALARTSREVAERVPCFVAELGLGAYRERSTWDDAWREVD